MVEELSKYDLERLIKIEELEKRVGEILPKFNGVSDHRLMLLTLSYIAASAYHQNGIYVELVALSQELWQRGTGNKEQIT